MATLAAFKELNRLMLVCHFAHSIRQLEYTYAS